MTIVKRGINYSVERTLPVHVKNKLNKHLLEKNYLKNPAATRSPRNVPG